MTGSVAVAGAGISTLVLGGEGTAGRGGAASRRRTLALALALAVAAGMAGAVLGLVKQPDPGRTGEQFAYTASAAVETARQAETRARDLEKQLADAQAQLTRTQARLATLDAAEQDLKDFQEAERLGLSRYLKDSTALWGDERRRVETAIVRESRKNGLDPLLVAAVIHVESHFNPFAVSGVGARGLMQIMPPTAQWLLDKDPNDDSTGKVQAGHLFDPVLNIKLGTAYLAQLMDRFDGDLSMALIAYNAGPGTAHSLTPHSKAFRRLSVYPQAVLAAYRTLLLPPQQLASR